MLHDIVLTPKVKETTVEEALNAPTRVEAPRASNRQDALGWNIGTLPEVSSLSVLLDLASGRLSPVVAWNPDGLFFHLILVSYSQLFRGVMERSGNGPTSSADLSCDGKIR